MLQMFKSKILGLDSQVLSLYGSFLLAAIGANYWGSTGMNEDDSPGRQARVRALHANSQEILFTKVHLSKLFTGSSHQFINTVIAPVSPHISSLFRNI